MRDVDKFMKKYSVVKNFALPGGGATERNAKLAFDFGNWAQPGDGALLPGGIPSPENISGYIAPVQFQRIRHDVGLWREAVREAELAILPFRVRMQRMYVDTVLNPHLQALMLRRKRLTLLRDFDICVNGQPSETLTEVFKNQWFYDYLNHSLDAKAYGYSLIQLSNPDNDGCEVDLVRRFNVSPDRRVVSLFEYSVTGIDFDDPVFNPYLIFVKTPTEIGVSKCGYGWLYKVANIELMHRNLLQQNADYCQTFAHPLRTIKTEKLQGDADRKRYTEFLKNQGALAGLILDPSDEIEFHEANTGTGSKCYETFGATLEKMMSKMVLGHGDALDSVPGKLGKESNVEDAINEVKIEDGRFVAWDFKKNLVPKLQGLGVPLPQNTTIVYNNDDEMLEGQTKEAENALIFGQALYQLSQAGYQVDVTEVSERLDMNVIVKVQPANPGAPDEEHKRAADIQNRINLIYFKRHGKQLNA